MNRCAVMAMLMAAAVFGQEIHLKTRTISTRDRAVSPVSARPSPEDVAVHQIVQFDHPPNLDDLDALSNAGTVVGALPDNAVIAMGPRGGFSGRVGVTWTGVLSARDKMSPDLPAGDSLIPALIEFHPDVGREAQDFLLRTAGMNAERPSVLLGTHVVVTADRAALLSVAAHDEVSYVFPAEEGLLRGAPLNTCAGMMTMAGAVAQYASISRGWSLDSDHVAHLSYIFGSLTPKVAAGSVQTEVLRAMNEWSRVAGVVFQPGLSQTSPRTIVVKFVSGAHGDAYAFDGAGGALAHTFYPVPVNAESIAGDMHLDADERWNAGGDVDIYSVALHETGHAIGLGHSDKPGDVMYPYYRRGMLLSSNDIGAAKTLYGEPGTGALTAVQTMSALRLQVNAPVAATESNSVSMGGTVSGGLPPYSVQWQTDQGYSGKGSVSSTGAWGASAVTLVNGINTITVTAFDASKQSVSQVASITKTLPVSAGATPVNVSVSAPSSAVTTVSAATLSLSGTAGGGSGVTRVIWQTATGVSGVATGTGRWTIAGVPLLPGSNTIVVRAYDERGASGWASRQVVRR